MENEGISTEAFLDQAKSLVALLEKKDFVSAGSIIHEFIATHESSIFDEIGKFTRYVHNSIKDDQEISNIVDLAEKELPNAKARLEYVVRKTEEAANITLNAVETAQPLVTRMVEDAGGLLDAGNSSTVATEYLQKLSGNADTIRSLLDEILMAQEFQDLTGQVIQRVTSFVQEVETKLVDILSLSGERVTLQETTVTSDLNSQALLEKGYGPTIEESKESDRVESQDEVDELLSSLGF